jgi:hypothetical protein
LALPTLKKWSQQEIDKLVKLRVDNNRLNDADFIDAHLDQFNDRTYASLRSKLTELRSTISNNVEEFMNQSSLSPETIESYMVDTRTHSSKYDEFEMNSDVKLYDVNDFSDDELEYLATRIAYSDDVDTAIRQLSDELDRSIRDIKNRYNQLKANEALEDYEAVIYRNRHGSFPAWTRFEDNKLINCRLDNPDMDRYNFSQSISSEFPMRSSGSVNTRIKTLENRDDIDSLPLDNSTLVDFRQSLKDQRINQSSLFDGNDQSDQDPERSGHYYSPTEEFLLRVHYAIHDEPDWHGLASILKRTPKGVRTHFNEINSLDDQDQGFLSSYLDNYYRSFDSTSPTEPSSDESSEVSDEKEWVQTMTYALVSTASLGNIGAVIYLLIVL